MGGGGGWVMVGREEEVVDRGGIVGVERGWG